MDRAYLTNPALADKLAGNGKPYLIFCDVNKIDNMVATLEKTVHRVVLLYKPTKVVSNDSPVTLF